MNRNLCCPSGATFFLPGLLITKADELELGENWNIDVDEFRIEMKVTFF